MKKTVISALVAKDLEAELKRYTNSKLQFIASVNDGQHGECKPLPVPTEGQLAEAFKGQRYDWWNALFDERVTLDEAAGMLLGFSQIMTMDAKFVDAHKLKTRAPSRPVSPYLVTAFTDMQARITDWRNTSDRKYEPCELIEWAREKDFVADEVLEVWKAHDQPEAGEVEQATAPATPDAVEPEPQTAPATPGEKSIPQWLSVTSGYIAGLMKEGRYVTAKELFKALEAKAGTDSPFEKNRGSLYVREIPAAVSLKTMQNKWSEIRSLSR